MVADKSRKRFLAIASTLIGCFATSISWAEATLDGSMGSTGSFSGDFTIPDTVGQTRGSNLFHSFSTFNINSGESATFTGPASIDNVVSRVTGSNPSTFNGPLTSAIPSANFYFLNPNGILFKEGAQINVDGSFYATTSDFVRLGQDGVFYADPAAQSVLTSSPPSAFGFLDSNPGQIALEGTQLVKFFSLNQPDGATLSLVGGDIRIDQAPSGTDTFFGTETSRGSFLSSTWNRIEVVSVGSAGEAIPGDGAYELGSFSALGNIDITNGSVVDATETYIRGGQIVIDQSVVAPGFFFVVDMAPPPSGGSVYVGGSESVAINGGGAPLAIEVNVPGAGPTVVTRFDGGPLFSGITTYAGTPFPEDPPADVPEVRLEGGDVLLSGSAVVTSQRFGPGGAGDINITGESVEIRDGSLVATVNTYAGAGSDIVVDAEQVILDSEGNTSPVTGLTGLNATSGFSPVFGNESIPPPFDPYNPDMTSGDSGDITVNATGPGGLVARGASITTESLGFGRGGSIVLNASDIRLSTEEGARAAIASQSLFAGDAGQIEVKATGNIELSDSYEISASVAGTGTGGNVSVTAGGNITITGKNSGVASATVQAPPDVEDLFASFFGLPDFETMVAVFTDFGLVEPGADLFDVMGALQTIGLIDLGDPDPTAGNAGAVSVAASSLNMSGENRITSSTTSDGNGGLINIQVGSLNLDDKAEIRSRSGLVNDSTNQLEVGTGNGGDISITASSAVNMQNGASISSRSLGTGLAGNVSVNAGQTFDMSGGSSISTQATVSDGGNIAVDVVQQLYMLEANITTSVESGLGGGGNIDIDPKFVILNQSNILANAFGGPGGNINIVAGNFIVTPDSVIDASSALGLDGTVNISSPDEEVADDLAVLPDNYLDVTSLMSDRCGTSVGASSLVNAGPGGLAVDPDGYLPSFATATNQQDQGKGASQASPGGKRWWSLHADPALQLAQVSCTR